MHPKVILLPGIVAEIHHLLSREARQIQHCVVGTVLVAIVFVIQGQVSAGAGQVVGLGSRVWNKGEELGCVSIQLKGQLQGLFHGLLGLAIVTHHVAGVDKESCLLGILYVIVYLLQLDTFLDIVQNLLAPALKAWNDKATPRFLH